MSRFLLFALVVSAVSLKSLPAAEPAGGDRSPAGISWYAHHIEAIKTAKRRVMLLVVYFCDPAEKSWYADYAEGIKAAKRRAKMLLICFYDPRKKETCNRFKAETLDNPAVRKRLRDYVCVQLPLDAKITIQGKEVTLLKDAAFREMLGKPGIAIVDFASSDPALHGYVVSTFPITKKLRYTPEQMLVILDLPLGTLTQRTLVYAVRTHPDKPASTGGRINPHLLSEAESHSRYQARIRLQGHHRWGTRFRRINARLPAGLTASEVCAESWPGEHLVEAAIECVRCWRFSKGHWSAVRAFHRLYGYDMKRGPNGIWYATGIFGRGRRKMNDE